MRSTAQPAPATSRSRRAAKRLSYAIDDVRSLAVSKSHASTSVAQDVVLAYHRVGGLTPSPVDLSTSMFGRQMAHLRASEHVITLDQLVAAHQAKQSTTVSSTVLTFDDGTADFVDIALPILVRYSLPATLYLATDFVDSGRLYPANGRPVSWNALRDAMSTGLVTIGAHTHTHRLLDRCTESEAAYELQMSASRIEDELGVAARHFAYPKAVAPRGGSAEALVRSWYDSAAIAGTRPNSRDATDLWRLRRSPIQNADGWEGFRRKVTGGMRSEDDLRRVINLVRYRGVTS